MAKKNNNKKPLKTGANENFPGRLTFIYKATGIYLVTFCITKKCSMLQQQEIEFVTDAFPVEQCHAGNASFNAEQ